MTQPAASNSIPRRRERPPVWVYLVAVIPAGMICTIVGLQPYVDPADLFRDPLTVADDAAARGECCHVYYGFISQLGGLIWAGGAAIALFAASVLFSRGNARTAWQFMAAAGLLTALLVIDDMFQGHELLYPTLFGIRESATAGIYAGLTATFVWTFRRLILDTGPALLSIAFVAFAISVATDLFVSAELSWHRLTEDGSKFVGITAWTTYFWWAGWTLVIAHPRVKIA